MPGIVTAPRPPKLIERGKYGVSVWATVLLDKFLYGWPCQRLLQDLSDHGLPMSPGTLAGGLRALAPLFEPLEQALLTKLRGESRWHADETRWAVFVELAGKAGHRWYLRVFQSSSVIYYALAPSRSADVVEAALAGVEQGILSCDRCSAYKKFARLHHGVVLAYCRAHQRRDFLELANAHPDCLPWASNHECAPRQAALRQAVEEMKHRCEAGIEQAGLAEPAIEVLQSMKAHWTGLAQFVDHPWIPMDNNAAERAIRGPVVGRKNFYGSGSPWSGHLAATMYSLFMTARLWGLNARTWLCAYLQACADNGGRAPAGIDAFLPWAMDSARLASLRAGLPEARAHDFDRS